jgi:hypothetical protein
MKTFMAFFLSSSFVQTIFICICLAMNIKILLIPYWLVSAAFYMSTIKPLFGEQSLLPDPLGSIVFFSFPIVVFSFAIAVFGTLASAAVTSLRTK